MRVFKAIMTALLGIIVFAVSYLLTQIVIGGILNLLFDIPVINLLVAHLFESGDGDPTEFVALIGAVISYALVIWVNELIYKEDNTKGLSCIIAGSIILLIHIISFVINLVSGYGILANIAQALAAIVIISYGIQGI